MNETVRIPLSIFERYMLRDHSAEYPMMQLLHADFRGDLDPARLSAAFDQALFRHPLLTARVEGSGKRAQWAISPAGSPVSPPIRFASVQKFADIPATFADIIEPSLGQHVMAWHLPTETGCKLLMAVNHVAADGFGIAQLMADWLTSYEQLYQGNSIEAPDLQERIDDLPRRGLPGWRESEQTVTRWQAIRNFFRETLNWYLRSPQQIAAPTRSNPALAPCNDIFVRTLTAHETRGLRHAALAQGVTLNDLMLREIFLCLANWNTKHGQQRPRDWLRILMPTSLRSSKDKSLSAVNRLGYTFLTHRAAECENPDQLLESLKAETAAIRKWNLGQMFLDGMAFAEKIPGLWSLFTRRKSCLATAVFSNIGEISHRWLQALPREGKSLTVGGVVVERIYGAPPLRHGTRVVILASLAGEELTLSGLTDSRYLDAAQSQEWWDMLFTQLQQTSAAGWAMKSAKTAAVSSEKV